MHIFHFFWSVFYLLFCSLRGPGGVPIRIEVYFCYCSVLGVRRHVVPSPCQCCGGRGSAPCSRCSENKFCWTSVLLANLHAPPFECACTPSLFSDTCLWGCGGSRRGVHTFVPVTFSVRGLPFSVFIILLFRINRTMIQMNCVAQK